MRAASSFLRTLRAISGQEMIAGYAKGCGEGGAIPGPLSTVVGRWAGDRIAFVGDYDSPKLWESLPSFRNITPQLVSEWNAFIELPDKKLATRSDCSCQSAA